MACFKIVCDIGTTLLAGPEVGRMNYRGPSPMHLRSKQLRLSTFDVSSAFEALPSHPISKHSNIRIFAQSIRISLDFRGANTRDPLTGGSAPFKDGSDGVQPVYPQQPESQTALHLPRPSDLRPQRHHG